MSRLSSSLKVLVLAAALAAPAQSALAWGASGH
ncbi:endonuclease, partial [Pseudomonas sp. HMWF010]